MRSKARESKGSVKEKIGEITGDPGLRDEGQSDRTEGKVQQKVGQVQSKVGNALKKAGKAISN